MKHAAAALALLLLAALGPAPAPARAAEASETRFRLHLAQMRRLDLDTVWNAALDLEDLGRDAVPLAVEALASEKAAHVRLGLSKALYELESPQPEAVGAVLAGPDERAAVMAARLLGLFGEEEEEEILRGHVRSASSPLVQVACAAALWDITRSEEWKGFLQNLLTSGDGPAVRRAALALARMGDLPLVKGFLEKTRLEPSLQGRLAQAVLDAEEIRSAQAAVSVRTMDLVEEVAARVQRSYVDTEVRPHDEEEAKAVDRPYLVDAAAAGITGSLDRFCAFVTRKEYEEDRKRATGSYAGIGAYVQLVDFDIDGDGETEKILKIDRPIYTPPAPAYKAGLRSADMVLEVEEDGGWTSLVGTTLPEAITKLKGPVGTTVRIRVKRRGRQDLVELEITRALITINVAVPDMMPGGVGYIYLKRFDNKASKDLERALTALEKQGMKGLVLDLRGNPGGSLQEVVECCRKFLNGKGSLLITYTRGRTDDWSKHYYTSRGSVHPPFPMAVLIDNDSASGSEMLSGALQAYRRAVVIGETSYGKGSGQTVFPLVSTRGSDGLPQRYMRMTIFKYYLPNKTSIHGRGVRPDIVVEYEKITAFQYFWQEKLLREESVTHYVDTLWKPANLPLLEKLARFDGFDEKAYPGFEAFYASLDTKLDRDYVRRMVRLQVKDRLQDEKGKAYLRDDFQEDPQVQRAILEVLRRLEIDPASIPAYRHFAKK